MVREFTNRFVPSENLHNNTPRSFYRDGNVYLASTVQGLEGLSGSLLYRQPLRIAYIPTAAGLYEKHGMKTQFLDTSRQWLAEKKQKGILDWVEYDLTGKTPEQLNKDFEGINGFYVDGGNTQRLVEELQRSGGNIIIPNRVLNHNALFIALSAGAIAAGPNIYPVALLEPSQATQPFSTEGLQLTSSYIFPHWDNPDFRKLTHEGKTITTMWEEMQANGVAAVRISDV